MIVLPKEALEVVEQDLGLETVVKMRFAQLVEPAKVLYYHSSAE